MIKLKKLIKEHSWDRKFGESLPTLKDVTKKHQTIKEAVKNLSVHFPKRTVKQMPEVEKFVKKFVPKAKFKRKGNVLHIDGRGKSLKRLSQSIYNEFLVDKVMWESVDKETIVESNIKVVKSDKIDSRTWRSMKYDLRDQFDELVDIGPDYGVFQNAQGTNKILKQIKRLMDKIS